MCPMARRVYSQTAIEQAHSTEREVVIVSWVKAGGGGGVQTLSINELHGVVMAATRTRTC